MLDRAQRKPLTTGAEGCNFAAMSKPERRRPPKGMASKLLRTSTLTLRGIDWVILWDVLRVVMEWRKMPAALVAPLNRVYASLTAKLESEAIIYVDAGGKPCSYYDTQEVKGLGK